MPLARHAKDKPFASLGNRRHASRPVERPGRALYAAATVWSRAAGRQRVQTFDTLVIGGGLVGSAIAYGVARRGGSVALIDEGDVAVRASRGNFALVWVQGKGDGMPRYGAWTRRSADLWPDFADEIEERTGIDVCYEKPGGVFFCFDTDEMAERRALLARLKANAESPGYDYEMLDRDAIAGTLPGLGHDLPGGSYCPHDGHCSSLHLLRALHAAVIGLGRPLPARTAGRRHPRPGRQFHCGHRMGRGAGWAAGARRRSCQRLAGPQDRP